MKKIFRRTILKNIIVLLIGLFSFKYIKIIQAMEIKPYHHLSDGTFRNPPGSPKRDWSSAKRHGSFCGSRNSKKKHGFKPFSSNISSVSLISVKTGS